MTNWRIVIGDILDQPAEILVCSANPFLTLSGGVGGAFLLRYGALMQEQLQAHLDRLGVRHVPPETVVCMPPCNSPYHAVLHAVAVDGFYESSPAAITRVVRQIMTIAVQRKAASVVMPALATGYGHLSMADFIEALRPLRETLDGPARMILCLKREEDAILARKVLEIADTSG